MKVFKFLIYDIEHISNVRVFFLYYTEQYFQVENSSIIASYVISPQHLVLMFTFW